MLKLKKKENKVSFFFHEGMLPKDVAAIFLPLGTKLRRAGAMLTNMIEWDTAHKTEETAE